MKIDCNIKQLYYSNQSTHDPWHWIFVTAYCLLTVSAFVSNSLLLVGLKYRHTRQKQSQAALPINLLVRQPNTSELTRNMLISYLAVLDLFLGLTIPFSALDGLSKFWPLGPNTEFVCRLAKASPSAVVYASSMVIMLIAFNCYRQIMYPFKAQLMPSSLKYITTVIVVASLCLSFPQFYYTKLFHIPPSENVSQFNHNGTYYNINYTNQTNYKSNVNRNDPFPTIPVKNMSDTSRNDKEEELVDDCKHLDEPGWNHVIFCVEDWPFSDAHMDPTGRLYYTWISFSLQLVLPLIVISVCYLSIYCKLKRQWVVRRSLLIHDTTKLQNDDTRCKRRNKQMLIICLVYLISWFPLGIVSILLDYEPNIFGSNTAHITMIFVICHLLGMFSASLNPVIYGYKNKQIRKGMECIIHIMILRYHVYYRSILFKIVYRTLLVSF